MKVEVNKNACIGCGTCYSICENVFDIGDDGLAFVKNETNFIVRVHKLLKKSIYIISERWYNNNTKFVWKGETVWKKKQEKTKYGNHKSIN